MTERPGLTDIADRRPDRVGANAAVVGGITVLARAAGFGRILVLTWAVGLGGVLDVYNTANRIPNILYEIVAGGALASIVVPALATPLARRQPHVAARTASGLLTWALVILVPLAVVVAWAAEPIMRLLEGGDATAAEIAMGAQMLRIFAPQLPLYGLGVVLTGILHAHRVFGWPALAPLLSSLTVTVAYTWYGLGIGSRTTVAQVPAWGELILAAGTTAATVVMTCCLLIPLRRTGIRLRPTLRFTDADTARTVRALAVAGAVTVGAWQLSLLLILGLTNGGPTGTVGMFQITLTLYMLPWGVFALPLALSSFPVLSQAHSSGDIPHFTRVLAGTTRRVVLLAGLGAAGLIGLSRPLAELFALIGTAGASLPVAESMRATLVALGPGLLGFCLFPLLSRALFAQRAVAPAVLITASGWGCTAVAVIGFSLTLPAQDRAVAVAAGNTVGMSVLGAGLLCAVARRRGRAAVAGLGRTLSASLTAGIVAAAAGWYLTQSRSDSIAESIVSTVLGGAAILLSFGVVSYVIDKPLVRPILARLRNPVIRG